MTSVSPTVPTFDDVVVELLAPQETGKRLSRHQRRFGRKFRSKNLNHIQTLHNNKRLDICVSDLE